MLTRSTQVYFTVQQIDLKDEKVDIDFEAGKIVFSAGDYAIDIEVRFRTNTHAPLLSSTLSDVIHNTVECTIDLLLLPKCYTLSLVKGSDSLIGFVSVQLFDGLKTEGSKWNNTGREIQFLLMKNEEKWWDRLTKAPSKSVNHHLLLTPT